MENGSGLSASDVLALTRDNNNGFLGGNAGGILALIIVFILLFGNGGWGNNSTTSALQTADLQTSLYFQSQDGALRDIRNAQCGITDSILTSSYNNLVSMKDISQQLSNSIAAIGMQVAEQGNATRAMIQQNYINELSDKLQTTRDELSNTRQTATITQNILGNLGEWRANPPCYTNYGCGCNGLY